MSHGPAKYNSAYLPYAILHYVNKTLANMKGYFGHIEDVVLSICKEAYIINDIYLNKTDTVTKKQTTESHSANFSYQINPTFLSTGSYRLAAVVAWCVAVVEKF